MSDLTSIAAEAAKDFAAAPDPAAPGASPPPQPEPDLDEAEAREWSQCPAVFAMIVTRMLPELRDTYTPENNLKWGRAVVPVARRYGWTAAKFFAWLGPWVGLALATHEFAAPTYDAIRAKLAEKRKARAEAAAQDAAPAAAPAAPAATAKS